MDCPSCIFYSQLIQINNIIHCIILINTVVSPHYSNTVVIHKPTCFINSRCPPSYL